MPWERRRYRRNKVWIEVDDQGAPVLDDRGLAALRYKPNDSRTYTVRPDELAPVDAAPVEASGEGITIYTDGASSGNPGPAGLGVVLLWRDKRREIQRYLGEASNNQAELEAILAGLRAVKRPELPVTLHTDSAYALGVLTEGHKVKANAGLIDAIRTEMARFAHLAFMKVAAHAGVPGNERADRLARDAIRTGTQD